MESQFSESASEREVTLQRRKQLLLVSARKRYLSRLPAASTARGQASSQDTSHDITGQHSWLYAASTHTTEEIFIARGTFAGRAELAGRALWNMFEDGLWELSS